MDHKKAFEVSFMNNSNSITVIIVVLAGLAIVILLMWKNKKDKKVINPDAENSVEESKMDHGRRTDKI